MDVDAGDVLGSTDLVLDVEVADQHAVAGGAGAGDHLAPEISPMINYSSRIAKKTIKFANKTCYAISIAFCSKTGMKFSGVQ